MENTRVLVVVLILTTLTIQKTVEGTCVDGGGPVTDVSSRFVTTVVTGTAHEGFSIKCEFNSTKSYSLHLWQLKISNNGSFDIVFSYFAGTTPPTTTPGSGYMNRGLTFENNNTVLFPNFTRTDVTNTNFECTIQLNTASVICTETKMLSIFAEPVTSIEDDVWEDRLPAGRSQVLSTSGTDYLPASATFRMTVGTQNRTLSATITDGDNGFKSFASQLSFEAPDVTSLKVDTFMNVDGSEVLIDSKTFEVYQEPVFLLGLVIVALISTFGVGIAVGIAAWKCQEKRALQIAALLVAIIGGVISLIFILLMVFLYRNSAYFIATVVLGAFDIGVAVAVTVITIKFWTARK